MIGVESLHVLGSACAATRACWSMPRADCFVVSLLTSILRIMIAVSSMADVGHGSSVTNRRRSRHESSANLAEVLGGFTGIGRMLQDNPAYAAYPC